MFTRTAQQATAATFAAIVTLTLSLGLNSLAVQPHADAELARSATPAETQVVVITGQRIART